MSSDEGLTTFPLEDAYIGILAKRVGIAPLQLNRKHVLITGPRVGIGLEVKKLTISSHWDMACPLNECSNFTKDSLI